LVRLERDLAHVRTVTGDFHAALPLELAAISHFKKPADQAMAWGGVCRAAGGAGEWSLFEDAWIETWHLVRAGKASAAARFTLMDLAHGARSIREFRRAAHAAKKALEFARMAEDSGAIHEAEAFLSDIAADLSQAPI
jgi:hypothetical protein